MPEGEVEKSAWNLSEHLVREIASLVSSSGLHFRRGRIQECFFDSEEIRNLIHTDLQKEEQKVLDTQAKIIGECNKIKSVLLARKESRSLSAKKQKTLKKAQHLNAHFVKNYRRQVMTYLAKYGYWVGKKEDGSSVFD